MPNTEKYGQEQTPYLDIFDAVYIIQKYRFSYKDQLKIGLFFASTQETNKFSINVFIVKNKEQRAINIGVFFANFDYDQHVNLAFLLFTMQHVFA